MSARGTARAVAGLVVVCALGAGCGLDGREDRAQTDEPGQREQAAPVAEPQVYEGTFDVLSSAQHGPELCTGLLASDPPQCRGLPVVGWDWEAVEGETVSGSTINGRYHVTGTYTRDAFILTASPGPPEPGEQGPLFDLSQVCDAPDGADVPDGELLWTYVWVGGTKPVVPDLVSMWQSHDPFVLNVIVRPGSGAAAMAAIRQVYPGPPCVVERDTPTEAELHALQDELSEDPAAREALGLQGVYSDWQRGVVVAMLWAVEPASTAYAQDRWGDRVELRGYLDPVDA